MRTDDTERTRLELEPDEREHLAMLLRWHLIDSSNEAAVARSELVLAKLGGK